MCVKHAREVGVTNGRRTSFARRSRRRSWRAFALRVPCIDFPLDWVPPAPTWRRKEAAWALLRREVSAALHKIRRQRSYATPIQVYPFRGTSPRRIELRTVAEQSGFAVRPGDPPRRCLFFRLKGALELQIVSHVFAHVAREHRNKYDRASADSVDGLVAFEYYPFKDGQWKDEGLRELIDPFAQEVLLPYVRERMGKGSCALADILVRRYLPGERRTHAAHFDGTAFATAVLGLSHPTDYVGGLYAQPGPHVSSRRLLPLEPGDLIVHSFDLQHGVVLERGVRYSMVFWIKDSPESVLAGTCPWQDVLAKNGDADALYHVAQGHETGIGGRPFDPRLAASLYRRSASLGNYFAQHRLSRLCIVAHSRGQLGDGLERAAFYLRAGAARGFAVAQKHFALALVNGCGVCPDARRAAVWMERAAGQEDLEAMFLMGEFYRVACGVSRDLQAAAAWYVRSAALGFPLAQRAVGFILKGACRKRPASGCSMFWLRRAARQGDRLALDMVHHVQAKRLRSAGPRTALVSTAHV